MNPQRLPPFDTSLRGQIRKLLKGRDVFGTAIRISAVIESIHSDEDVVRAAHLGPREGDREKDGVARRNVRDRNVVLHVLNRTVLGNVDVSSECRPAKS